MMGALADVALISRGAVYRRAIAGPATRIVSAQGSTFRRRSIRYDESELSR